MATHKCSGMGKGMKGSGHMKKGSNPTMPMKGSIKKKDPMDWMTKKPKKK